MKSRQNTFYFFAFLLALGLRCIQLGAIPLTDSEANWALQAISVAQGGKPLLGGQPGYILLTSIPFFLFESSNFLARFFPALAGSLLVFSPYLFREKLGERVALIAAFLLAAAPGMVAVSRQANGTMLAVTFTVFAWAMWQNERPQWAGVFAGLALLGGASIWMGLLGLGLSWALAQSLVPAADVDETEASPNGGRIRTDERKMAAIYGGATILLVGTLFLFVPSGLGALFSSLIDYLSGWRFASGIPATRPLAAILSYQILAFLFGAGAAIRGLLQKDRLSIQLSLWALVALLLVVIYPARQVGDLVWAALPLWMLAAKELGRHLRLPEIDRGETLGVAMLTVILLAFTWLNVAGMSVLPPDATQVNARLILIFGSLLLLAISLVLIAVGWAQETAVLGGVWGTLIMLGIYTLSAAWAATGLRTPKGVEMWTYGTPVPQAGWLLDSIEQISTVSTGENQSQPITISDVNSPALLWLLRNHEVIQVSVLDPLSAPPLVITPYTTELSLAASYRGQDFVWRQTPNWAVTSNWTKWLVLHEMPQDSEWIILWGRNDIFFDGQNPDQ